MAVLTTRASPATISTLRSRVLTAAGDPDGTRYGTAQVDQAINDQLFEMYNVLAADPATFLQSATLAYAGSATSTALTSALAAVPIYSVEDYTNASAPYRLPRIESLDLEGRVGQMGWALQDGSIFLRPTPGTAVTLRINYISNPFTIIGALTPLTDQHPYPVAHEELIVLGAVKKLERIDDQVSPTLEQDIQRLWERYEMAAHRYRGPRRVRATRQYG